MLAKSSESALLTVLQCGIYVVVASVIFRQRFSVEESEVRRATQRRASGSGQVVECTGITRLVICHQ